MTFGEKEVRFLTMMVLANPRSLQRGLPTAPVRLSVTFMQSIFNMELSYGCGQTFVVSGDEGRRNYQLHHLTQADLQLAIILQKVCSTNGRLHNLSALSNVYDKLREYFEDPICLSQFYASLEKFRRHGIIDVHHDNYTSTYSIDLQHYLNSDTQRLGYHVKAHPFIFSKQFSQLSLREQKLFLTFYLQQGIQPSQQEATFRCFMPTKSEHIEYQDLRRFLHANITHVRGAIERLRTMPIFNGEPLFTKVFYVKDGRSFEKVFMKVNPKLHEHSLGEECHDQIEPRLTYQWKSKFLESLLHEYGIGTLVDLHGGSEFNKMVRLLRTASRSVMKYVVHKLYNIIMTNESYPAQVVPLVYDAVRNRTKLKILALAKEHGIERLITAGHDESFAEQREFDLASKLSVFSEKQLKRMVAQVAPVLIQSYMVPYNRRDLKFRYDSRLDIVYGISVVRERAFKLLKDPRSYFEIEQRYGQAIYQIQRTHDREDAAYHQDIQHFLETMLAEVDSLPSILLTPHVPDGFRLEDELLSLWNRVAA
jgi:hypothetical protein